MARQRQNAPTHASDSMLPYRKPDPETVARIMSEYGEHVVHERWSSWSASKLTDLAREGRRLKAARGQVDTSAMRDCVCCRRPFFSRSAGNVVCSVCRHESTAVFE
jgi:hypothetical protein